MAESKELIGVILAAGKGVRAYPSTRFIPKVLLQVDGKALIERNIELLRDQLGINKIIVVIGYLGHKITEFLSARDLGVGISFVVQPEQKGIGNALLAAEEHLVNRQFVLVLGDELYIDSNHSRLLDFVDNGSDAALCFREEKSRSKISRNYIGRIENGKILQLTEKPDRPNPGLMGVGTYLLNDSVFAYIRDTKPSELRNEVEITDVLNNMTKALDLRACVIEGEYVNITTADDINFANYVLRDRKFDRYTVSVVIPAYNEEATIGHVIEDFKHHAAVNEVVVIDNNSKDGSSEIAKRFGARVITEKKQGYGCAIMRGLGEAGGDIVVIVEADGSFRSKDVPKLLEYIKECDMVIGTRTTRQMIEQGANMYGLLRWGNVAFGKIVQLLWWNHATRFTDVGCTYRAIWKSAYEKIMPLLKSSGPEFSPEMMIAVLKSKMRVIEVPVSYYRRVGGESKHSKNFIGASKTAIRMLKMIFRHRLNRWTGSVGTDFGLYIS